MDHNRTNYIQETPAGPHMSESDSILRSFYASAPMMMGVVEVLEDDLLHISDNAATARFILGDSATVPDIMTNRLASEMGVPREHIQEWIGHYRECIRTRKPVRFEYSHNAFRGLRWLSATVSYITTTAQGRPRCSYIVEDVTDQKQAADALHQQSLALKASEQRLRTVIDNFPNGSVVLFDADMRFIVAGGRGLTEAGIPPASMEGKTPMETLQPDIAATNERMMRSALAGEKSVAEVAYGDRIYEMNALPIHNEAGEVVAGITLIQDITAHKVALQEIEQLNVRLQRSIQETHHRVKNNLQIISAFAEMEIIPGEDMVPATALMRVSKCARMLAAVHDILVKTTKAEARTDILSTRSIMDTLVPLLRDTSGGRHIWHQVDDFPLPVRQVSSLAMLVNEIVSNAIKHGTGDIAVLLLVKGDTAYLEVTDQGPGFPADFDPQVQGNTGMELIESTGRYDLQGIITYDTAPEGGGRVRVVFPVPSL